MSIFKNKKACSRYGKIIAAVCSVALVMTALPAVSTTVSAQVTLTAKTTAYLNLRSGKGVNYSVMTVIPKDSTVTILDRSDSNWIKVKLSDGKVGYCSTSYLDVINDGKTTTYLNFRQSPDTGSSIIKTLSPDTKLDIINFSGSSWAKVSLSDGKSGYVCTDYIEYLAAPAATVSSKPVQQTSTVKTNTVKQESGTTEASAKTKNTESKQQSSNTEKTTSNPMKLSITSRSVAIGNNFYITVSGNKGTVKWTTSNGNIATVTSNGIVKGISAGTAIIKAKDSEGHIAYCKTSVVKTDYTQIRVSDAVKTLKVGSSFTLSAKTTPAGGKVYYKSEDTGIAKVDSKGKVTAKSKGTVWITAHDSTGIITSSCRLTVEDKAKITLSKSSLSLSTGNSERISATFSPSTLSIKWFSSDNSIASVNNGLVSGLRPGTVTITAKDTSGQARATCKVTVSSSYSGSVGLSRYTATTTAGKTIYIKGYNGYKWQTSDSSIATVKDGFICTKKAGSVAISCVNSSGNRAVCVVKVSNAAPIRFAYSSPNSATINSDVELIAITDKTRTGVYFMVNIDGKQVKVKATSKTANGGTYVWKGSYKTTKAGTFKVTAYSCLDGTWTSCADGKCDIFVAEKTHSTKTGLDRLRASDEVIKYIGLKEGFVSSVTYDTLANNIPTLGHGYVVWEGQCFYDNLTKDEAYALLVKAVNEEVYSKRVNDMLIQNNIRFNQQQFDALVSFSYNLGTGWTYSSDLKTILLNSYGTISGGSSTTAYVTASSGLNLRSEPTTSSSTILVLSHNEKVTLVSTQKFNNVWYKVKTGSGKVGYCSSSYLNVGGSSSSGRDLNYVNKNALIREMLSYHHAGGVCYYGLLYRRADELEMFLYNDYKADGRDNNHNFPNPGCISFP